MKILRYIILVLFMVVVSNTTIFAYVIGSDEKGIICFTDNIDPLNNEWVTLDLDFDGNYESYYFNKNGYLERNREVNGYFVNELGQKHINAEPEIINVGPSPLITYMIDNVSYYYIDKVKSEYTKNWEYDDKKKVRVTIQIPSIVGVNDSIVSTVNNLIKTRGLELLKLYCKEEAYRANTRKVYISIDKYDKKKPHELNFIPTFNDKFYFNFTVINGTDDNKDRVSHIGLVIDTIDNTCEISNTEYKKLNNLSFTDEEETKETTSAGKDYNSRYEDIVKDLREEYVETLQEYFDNADDFVSECEQKTDSKEAQLRAVENYVKDIKSIYNTYLSKAKDYKKAGTIDDDTYNRIDEEFKDTLSKYQSILSNALQGDINAIKEDINRERLQE